MTRPKLVVVNNTDLDEPPRSWQDGRKYRFDLSKNKLILYTLSSVLALCFMFTLGILVGRGVAMVSSDDSSAKGRFLQFLGLGKQTGQPSAKAAQTWEDPRKMLESLNYYEDLTHKGGAPLASVPKAIEPAPADSVTESPKEPVKEPSRRVAAPRQPAEKPTALQPDKPRMAGLAAEQYTLLVASLKETDAQGLIEKLRARGYSPRVETLDLGASKWNRILVGSFPSREAAIVFAEEFNRKEKLEALVMSGSN
jgi:cell division septation protein DedD